MAEDRDDFFDELEADECTERYNEAATAHLNDSMKKVFSSEEGRHLLHAVFKDSNLFGLTFDPDNGAVTAYNEGRRSVALELFDLMNELSPTSFEQMMKEAAERDIYYRNIAEGATSNDRRTED